RRRQARVVHPAPPGRGRCAAHVARDRRSSQRLHSQSARGRVPRCGRKHAAVLERGASRRSALGPARLSRPVLIYFAGAHDHVTSSMRQPEVLHESAEPNACFEVSFATFKLAAPGAELVTLPLSFSHESVQPIVHASGLSQLFFSSKSSPSLCSL